MECIHISCGFIKRKEKNQSWSVCLFEKLLVQICEFCLWKQDSKAQASYPESET